MTRLRIRHSTGYDYAQRVTLSYNEARMTPRTDTRQVVLESSLTVSPAPAALSTYRDYWGTHVKSFDVQVPHDHLQVTADMTVEVRRAEDLFADDDIVGWDRLLSDALQNDFSDWLPQTPLSDPGDQVRGLVRDAVEDRNPREAARAVFRWLSSEMQYMPGVTGVHSSAGEAWRQRQGVCQDLAHLGIGALRTLGIPARYVSGYVHPRRSAAVGETAAGESHAWIEWWDGRWCGWDPTNNGPVGDFHVSVAHGRDYRDVSPLRGILSGGSGSALNVTVEITRLA